MQAIGATMTYVGGSSNKYYRLVLAGPCVYVSYGRRGNSGGQIYGKTFPTVEAACAETWKLLRAKTGKGYHIVDAACFDLPETTVDTSAPYASLSARRVDAYWCDYSDTHRSDHQRAVLFEPDLAGRSPRTAREGATVLADLLDPACPVDRLIECAIADPTERFLPSIALSHPNCTDEVEVAAYLVAPLTP